MRGGKARPKAGCWFDLKKWFVPDSIDGRLAKKPHLKTSFRVIRAAGSHLVKHLVVSPILKDGSHGRLHPLCVESLHLYQHHLHEV